MSNIFQLCSPVWLQRGLRATVLTIASAVAAPALVQAQADAEATRKLAAAEQEARLLAQALEDQANADPVAVPLCLSADRVRRLDAPAQHPSENLSPKAKRSAGVSKPGP